MFDSCGILFLFFEQPAHPGSSESTATIDLPIQRERHTSYPMIQSSGLKGALLAAARELGVPDADRRTVFGAIDASDIAGGAGAGAIVVTDARMLLFPVKSAFGVFGWTTSPHVLARLAADLHAGQATPPASTPGQPAASPPTGQRGQAGAAPTGRAAGGGTPIGPRGGTAPRATGRLAQSASAAQRAGATQTAATEPAEPKLLAALGTLSRLPLQSGGASETALWPAQSPLQPNGDTRIFLEERIFTPTNANSGAITAWQNAIPILAQQAAPGSYWPEEIKKRSVLLPEGAFGHFARFATDIETHIKVDDNGRVADTGPWEVEFIPSESVMYALIGFQRTGAAMATAARDIFTNGIVGQLSHLQLGGDATLGRGIAALRYVPVVDLLN